MAGLPELKAKVNTDLDKVYATLDTYDKTGADIRARVDQLSSSGVRTLDDAHAWLGPSTGDFHSSMANIHAITDHIHEKLPGITVSASRAARSSTAPAKVASAFSASAQASRT